MDYREQNGRFKSRAQLLKVPKLGPKAYEQCAGFLRILDGENPLDATSVHPESYQAAMQLLDKMGLTMEDVRKAQKAAAVKGAVKKEVTNVVKKDQKPRQQKVVIRNTNTAMGKALAAIRFTYFPISQRIPLKRITIRIVSIIIHALRKYAHSHFVKRGFL